MYLKSESWVWAQIIIFGLLFVAVLVVAVLIIDQPCKEGAIVTDSEAVFSGLTWGGPVKICKNGKLRDLNIEDFKK